MLHFSGRIPITYHPAFFIVVLLISWLQGLTVIHTAIWAVVIIISILVHEFGHALTAIAFGQHARIEFIGFGGLTHRHGKKLKLWKEFFVVLDGPCAGFLLCISSFFLYNLLGAPENALGYGLRVSIFVNLFWTLLNLFPIYPLDGGHLMSILFQGIFGYRGIGISLIISMILAVLISCYLFLVHAFLAGAIVLILAFESFRAWKATSAMTEQDQNEDLQEKLKHAQELILDGRNHEALELLKLIQSEAKAGFIYVTATEYIAKLLDNFGDSHAAYEIVKTIKNQLSMDGKRFYHSLAYRTGDFTAVVEVGNQVFQDFPSSRVAEVNALSHASRGEVDAAVGWLQRAYREGSDNLLQVIQQTEFDAIRHLPSFEKWMKEHHF